MMDHTLPNSVSKSNALESPVNRRKASIIPDERCNNSQIFHRRPSIIPEDHIGEHMYQNHTETSYRRMSLTQQDIVHGEFPGGKGLFRRFSNSSDDTDILKFDEHHDLDPSSKADIAEIKSEIRRVEHFMNNKKRNMKLEQLKQDLTHLKKSVEFDEELEKQQLASKRKSSITYSSRRHSVTKAAYL